MAEDVTKKLAVTFADGLPLGTHARFKHDGDHWIAFPAKKLIRILSGYDRMIGIFNTVQRDLTKMINDYPTDAARVAETLAHVVRLRTLHREIVTEKVKAQTQ